MTVFSWCHLPSLLHGIRYIVVWLVCWKTLHDKRVSHKNRYRLFYMTPSIFDNFYRTFKTRHTWHFWLIPENTKCVHSLAWSLLFIYHYVEFTSFYSSKTQELRQIICIWCTNRVKLKLNQPSSPSFFGIVLD